ncbi:exodeoxyribonuclease VII, small subunit [Neisseria flavescens]|nr:exodeoxyribonuclease VII, small subunit [Neisseria flavescens]
MISFSSLFRRPSSSKNATIPLFCPSFQTMKKNAPKSFEEALSRLETLTQAMQSSEMPLEDALAAYQEGNELVRYCQTKLAEVEQKLQVLDAGELKELNLEPGE